MEIVIIGLSVAQIISICLGTGSSTLAVLNFFNAISDGIIDATERRMMAGTYLVLRTATHIIFITTLTLAIIGYLASALSYFTPYIIAQFILISVLYLNSYLMTKKVISSKYGPAIQAGSWYLLGFGVALLTLSMTDFSLLTFFIAYALELIFSYLVINYTMSHLKKKLPQTDK